MTPNLLRAQLVWTLTPLLLFGTVAGTLAGCQSTPREPLPLAEDVDLERFMGDWYVIGGILTDWERGAHNAVERYELADDGTIDTTFSFWRGGFDGERVEFHPTGIVRPGTGNAVWGMRFLWPFTADYRIIRLDPDHDFTVIGREARDYVWIMARQPELDPGRWDEVVAWLGSVGYDTSAIRRVPQSWEWSG